MRFGRDNGLMKPPLFPSGAVVFDSQNSRARMRGYFSRRLDAWKNLPARLLGFSSPPWGHCSPTAICFRCSAETAGKGAGTAGSVCPFPAVAHGGASVSPPGLPLFHRRHALLHEIGALLHRNLLFHRALIAGAHLSGFIGRRHFLWRGRFHHVGVRGYLQQKCEGGGRQAEQGAAHGGSPGSWRHDRAGRATDASA